MTIDNATLYIKTPIMLVIHLLEPMRVFNIPIMKIIMYKVLKEKLTTAPVLKYPDFRNL